MVVAQAGSLMFREAHTGAHSSLSAKKTVLAGLGDDLFAWTAAVRQTLERYLVEAGVPRPEVEAAVLFAVPSPKSQE